MKTINITFTVTDAEQELLRLGKCDKPSPQRIKMQLLVEAARNLRNMSETVVRAAREPARPNPRVNTKAELAEINRKRRADGLITGGSTSWSTAKCPITSRIGSSSCLPQVPASSRSLSGWTTTTSTTCASPRSTDLTYPAHPMLARSPPPAEAGSLASGSRPTPQLETAAGPFYSEKALQPRSLAPWRRRPELQGLRRA